MSSPSRRRGVTLIELMVASALLASALIFTYGLIEHGYRFAVELPRRERAHGLRLNLLSRYHGLSPDQLGELVGMDEEVDPLEKMDPFLEASDPVGPEALRELNHHRRVRFRSLKGELDGVGLTGYVTWANSSGGLEQETFGIFWIPPSSWDDSLEEEDRRPPTDLPNWGRAHAWNPPGHEGEELDPTKRRRGNGRPLSLRELAGQAAAAAAPDAARRKIRDDGPLRFKGRRGDVARFTGARGELGRSRGRPEAVVAGARAGLRRRFLKRAGLSRLTDPQRPFPDGRYLYHLDVLDRRGVEGEDRIHGIFYLSGNHEEHLLRAVSHAGKFEEHRLGGDEVLELRDLRAPDGTAWLLERTVDRLYLIQISGPLLERVMIVRSLKALDGSSKGLGPTRDAIVDLEATRSLEESDHSLPRPLPEAADRLPG